MDFLLDGAAGIGGRVTDAVSGTAIAGVTIKAGRLDEPRDLELGRIGFTDAAGLFTIASVPSGAYAVFTTTVVAPYVRQGFRSVPVTYCTEYLSPACEAELRTVTPVAVSAGVTTGAIDFQLRRGGSIAGRVTAGGQGVAAGVTVYDAAGIVVNSIIANTAGGYLADCLRSGAYCGLARQFPA